MIVFISTLMVSKKLVPKLLLQVYARKVYNIMVSLQKEGRLKESRYKDNNIIIGDSNLRNILPHHLKNTTY